MTALATEFLVSLTSPDDPRVRRGLEDYALSLADRARKRGFKACAGWHDEKLQLRFQEGSAEEMRAFLDPLLAEADNHGAIGSVVQERNAATPIEHLDDAAFAWGSLVQGRLTRDLLCALPEGAYVASTSEDDRGESIGRLGPFHMRAHQWQRAHLAGLDGRLCRVFWSERDYDAFLNAPNENMR